MLTRCSRMFSSRRQAWCVLSSSARAASVHCPVDINTRSASSAAEGHESHQGLRQLAAANLRLNNLRPNPGARKKAKRVGRGEGSGLGKTCGRGHKGHGQRGGGPGIGFEGGQYPLMKRVRKFGFTNFRFRVEYQTLNLDQLQLAVDTGRIDASQPVTLRTLRKTIFPKLSKGVKLLATGKEWFNIPLQLEVSACSKAAREAVEKAGGSVTTVYFNKLGLRTILRNDPEDIRIKFALAPIKKEHRFDVPRYPLNWEGDLDQKPLASLQRHLER